MKAIRIAVWILCLTLSLSFQPTHALPDPLPPSTVEIYPGDLCAFVSYDPATGKVTVRWAYRILDDRSHGPTLHNWAGWCFYTLPGLRDGNTYPISVNGPGGTTWSGTITLGPPSPEWETDGWVVINRVT